MGYDLHITRADFWAENHGKEISAEEWSALVESDAALTYDTRNGPYFATLDSVSDSSSRWLNWNEGNISSKNPDQETLRKMLEIAAFLGASVQGDDGEHYQRISDLPDPSDPVVTGSQQSDGVPRYLRRELGWDWIMIALIALAVLAVNLID